MRFPKSYNPTANDGKKYPILIFFHGDGEGGPVTDKCISSSMAGDVFEAAETKGTYDGYVLCMQTTNGFWGEPVYGYIQSILDYMITNNKLDPYRVNLNGPLGRWGRHLGNGEWSYVLYCGRYSDVQCDLSYKADSTQLKFTPMWLVQGGLDGAPDPGTAQNVVNAFKQRGCKSHLYFIPQ